MIETVESEVQIILTIKEGKGFEQISQPTLLIGTLNGYSLETNKIVSNSNPQYETDLIWETDRIALRKMRAGHTPLKLECFAFKENEGKERLGYIVLSIRSAQITSKHGNLSPKANWHKLLGLRNDLKAHKPELLLTLRIKDQKNTNLNTVAEKYTEIESHRNPSGDSRKCSSSCSPCETKNIIEKDNTMPCNCINKNYIKNERSYYCYCLHTSLMAITFISSDLLGRKIGFRFHHPKAEITSIAHTIISVSSSETIKLQDIGCQFHFISAPTEIRQLLQSFPPKISIYDVDADSKSLSLTMLDILPLFHEDKLKCQYRLPLYNVNQDEIGNMDIMLKLENRGPHYILKRETTDKHLGPPILDDSLAYKIVDELETWKERQKEMFKVELKKKEERHLNLLSEEWRKQKETLELKLACSVEQCKTLANSLNNATEDLRKRRLKSLENETRLIKANEDLQWRYDTKLQELKNSFHVMQNELTSKVTKLEEKKAALETQTDILLHENEHLKSSVNKQTDELQVYQKASLTQDQTASLLQELKTLEEKLNSAQQGKSFFKEQWGKAVREIHRMKIDRQQAMQVQIKNSKEELKNVDFAEILSVDTKALSNDQILLEELQKEIDITKSKQSYNQIFTPINNISSMMSYNTNKITSDKSEEYSKRLQALREERDFLLRTGNYAVDDIVIKKLNDEIQSLSVNI